MKSLTEIVSGTANGADKLGERYAKEYGYLLKQFPAEWARCGNLLVISETDKWLSMQIYVVCSGMVNLKAVNI